MATTLDRVMACDYTATLDGMMAYVNELPTTKSHVSLITWSREVTWQMKIIISPAYKMRSRLERATWHNSHVMNEKCYFSNSVSPMTTKRVRIMSRCNFDQVVRSRNKWKILSIHHRDAYNHQDWHGSGFWWVANPQGQMTLWSHEKWSGLALFGTVVDLASGLQHYQKRDSDTGLFLWILQNV